MCVRVHDSNCNNYLFLNQLIYITVICDSKIVRHESELFKTKIFSFSTKPSINIILLK